MGEGDAAREQAEEARVVGSSPSDRRAMTVTDILCLKVDHIGDLLIAAPALMRLRRAFAQARITLICSPWTTGLAKRLELADHVVAVTVFDESSVGDLDHDALARRLREAAATLDAMALGPFDLAIDLTVHPRSRDLLKLFRARVYAGFGDAEAFPFLDVRAPAAPAPPLEGPGALRLTAADLAGSSGHPVTDDGLSLTVRQATLSIGMETDQVWSPSEMGLADQRILGAGLLEVEVREPASADAASGWSRTFPVVGDGAEGLAFEDGWADWEPWGRWTRAEEARLRLTFAAPASRVRLGCRVQGHTGPHDARAKATVWIRAGGRRASRDFAYGDGPAVIELDVEPEASPPRVRTPPFQLAAGLYRGVLSLTRPRTPAPWAPLRLAIRGTQPPRTLTSLTTPIEGPGAREIDVAFDVRLDDHLEPLILELRREGDAGVAPAIREVALTRIEPRVVRTPSAHMEARLLELVAMVDARLGPGALEAEAQLARRLGDTRDGSTAAEVKAALHARKIQGRRLIGLGVGANKSTKLWPEAYTVELGRRLLERPDVDLVLFGGPKDAAVALGLAARLAAGERVIDLCGRCRIEDLGEALARLDGFIGLDTGPTHFAGRVGVKTLAIFGHAHDPAEWGPVGPRAAWIALHTPCADCGLSTASQCGFGMRCMTLLKPDDVWRAVEAHLLDAAD